MGLPGTIDSSVYEGLGDVLRRDPAVTTVTYEPDGIVKESLRAQVAPNRIAPPTGPESPTLDVVWRFTEHEQYYRIHYADPNTGFNCGWHRDGDHTNLGPLHFQYERPTADESRRERADFEAEIPTEILWTALDRLFDDRIPTLTG